MEKIKCAIVGSGNIGTDLMIKIRRNSDVLDVCAMAGIDPASDGLSRAEKLGVDVTDKGVGGLRMLACYDTVEIAFDATSAGAHRLNDAALRKDGKQVIDLTPCAIGPFVVPPVNIDEHMGARNMNMVTCGGQATIPIVHAVRRATEDLIYAEIVASIASRSAGPGTRANIDEFTRTTKHAIEKIGGARVGKAIIILNPADPPLIMRDTVMTLSRGGDQPAIRRSIEAMVESVKAYVPGYRLKQEVQFEEIGDTGQAAVPGIGAVSGLKTSVFLEVEGEASYLPAYAGNLDIMTSAAIQTAERWAQHGRHLG